MPMQGVPEMYGPPAPDFSLEKPTPEEILGASWRQSTIGSAISAAQNANFPPVDGYGVKWDDIKDNPLYVDHADEFAGAVSPAHFDSIKSRIEQDAADRRIKAASGTFGLISDLVTEAPLMLLPGRVAIGVLKTGMPVARAAAEVGAAAGLQTAGQEMITQAAHPHPLSESAVSIGSATILGGLLGAGIGWLHPGEGAAIAGKMDRERAETDAHVSGVPAPEPAMGAASGGAGVRDTRSLADLTAVPTGIGIEKLRDNVVTRSLQRASLATRRLATDLSETAVLVKGNLEGKTTTMNGMAPIETVVRTQQNVTEVKILDALTDAWKETNFGSAANAPWFAKLRDDLSKYGIPSPAKVTFEDFNKQVGDAVMSATPHENPHIRRVAEQIKPIFEEWSGRAERPGGVEGFKRAEQAPGESYFPHVWNKFMIQARRPQFVNKLVDKFSGDQAANAATQGRVRAHQGALESHEGNIAKYTRQLEKKQADLADDELLQEEVRRQNKFGYQTAERLRESSYENVGGIRVEAPEKNIGKAQGGTLFETEIRKRGNTLADRAAAHRAQIADLEEKLQAEHASAAAMRSQIEEEIGKWHGTSTAEAKSAIKAREKYEAEREAKRAAKGGEEPKGGRVRSADEAVDRAVQRMLESPQDLTTQELRDKADQTVNHILGSPDGRLPFDEAASLPQLPKGAEPVLRGSLAERSLDVTNDWAKDWIERDIHKVIKNYMRTFVPDVLLAERYGDAEMSNAFREIEEDYTKLINATGPGPAGEKEATRLGKERDSAIADIAMMRDRLRGLFQIPTTESQRRIGRISAAVRNFSHVTAMGMAAISSIPDAANVIARWGLNGTFGDAWAPFLKSMMTDRVFAKEALRQFKVMGIANETILASRHHSFHGLTEPYTQGSLVERTLQKGADTMQLLNLMAPQTDLLKTIAATVASTGIYRAAKRAAAGNATKRDLLQLGQANIPQHMWERIAEQYEKSGTDIDGHMLPNTEDWADKEARGHFEAALHREVNLSVVTPGIDKPAFISDPVLGVFTQFKSFTAAATTRILVANLQRSDAQTLQGLIASLGFGAMAYYVHSIASGQPISNRPQDVIKEAISRGNILGWLDEANTLSSKMTRGKLDIYRAIGADKPLSRDAGRTAVENLLGPTVGKLSNLTRVTGAMATGDVNAGDIKAIRRLVPSQNLWFWNRALTEVEKNVGSSLGIKQPQPRAQ
jgi:hypothetical protein